jgi:SAM-dependent methyltransferase
MLEVELNQLNEEIKLSKMQFFTITEDKKISVFGDNTNDLDLLSKSGILDEIKDKRVLDIGCNKGLFSFIVKQHGAKYVRGIDPLESSITLAKEIANTLKLEIDFRCEKFSKQLLSEEPYDIVLCLSSYHYLYQECQNHRAIFRMLSVICDEMYWENPWDMTDVTCKSKFDQLMPDRIPDYTREKILEALTRYFDYTFIGVHNNRTRYALKLTKKKFINDYTICENLFTSELTGSTVHRVEKNGKLYALKVRTFSSDVDIDMFIDSYKLYKDSGMEDMPEITKTILSGVNGFKYYTLMEYLDNYRSLATILEFTPNKLSTLDKLHLFIRTLRIMISLHDRGVTIIDFGPANVMYNEKTRDIKILDFDSLIKSITNEELNASSLLEYECQEKTNKIAYAYNFLIKHIKWFSDIIK